MKCIKLINPTKNTEVGTIVRVTEAEADAKVLTGNWKFVPKSEYKSFLRPSADEPVKSERLEKLKKMRDKNGK
jgi:hypothetical protein